MGLFVIVRTTVGIGGVWVLPSRGELAKIWCCSCTSDCYTHVRICGGAWVVLYVLNSLPSTTNFRVQDFPGNNQHKHLKVVSYRTHLLLPSPHHVFFFCGKKQI